MFSVFYLFHQLLFLQCPLAPVRYLFYAILMYTIVCHVPNSICTCIYFEYLAVDAGLIGLALTYALSMGSIFQYCIKQSTILEGLVSLNMFLLLTLFFI